MYLYLKCICICGTMKGISEKGDPGPETSTDGTPGLGTPYPGPENI